MKDKNKRICNGIFADVMLSTILYPINTLKINNQLNKKIIEHSFKNLMRGFKYGFCSEIISASVFYSLYENNIPTCISSCSSVIIGHPLNMRRKLAQINKSIEFRSFNDNYRGLNMSLLNIVPGTTVTFTTKEILERSDDVRIQSCAGILAVMISLILTHPLDGFCTAKSLDVKKDKLNFRGLKERLFEKTATLGTKMQVLQNANKDIEK